MRMSPGRHDEELDETVVGHVRESGGSLMKQLNKLQSTLLKRIDYVDANTRHMLKYQFHKLGDLAQEVQDVEQLMEEDKEARDAHSGVDRAGIELSTQALLDQRKKMQILNAVNAQYSNEKLTMENIQALVIDWMDVADADGNGELDLEEFAEFLQSIESIHVSPDDVQKVFQEFDKAGNGFLTCEAFATAVYQCLLQEEEAADAGQGEEHRARLARGENAAADANLSPRRASANHPDSPLN